MTASFRLLQAMAGPVEGGAERFCGRLAVGLHNRGIEQKVLVKKGSGWAARLREHNIDAIELPFGGFFDTKTTKEINALAKSWQPTLALTWMSRASHHIPSDMPCPVVARLGGYYPLKYYKKIDYLIGITPDLVEYFQKNGWAADKTTYLPNFAAAPQASAPAPLEMAKVRQSGGHNIVALGRLHENKGFDTLLQAVALLPNCTLWLAGSGKLLGALQQQAVELGIHARVHFIGWQENITPWLQSADVFVCPSRHEPLGSVLLEAWAHAVPMVATTCHGALHLITHEEDGLLTPINEPTLMAASIQRFLTEPNLAKQCAKAGFKRWRAEFSEEAILNAYLHYFENITGKKICP